MGLAITRDVFESLYAGAGLGWDLFNDPVTSEADLLYRRLPSKLYRLNTLYTIVSKDGQRIPFRMNLSQHRVYAESLVHPRLIILKSRQQGISTFWLMSYLDDALFNPDFSVGMMAQGKAEASTLLKRVKLAWDELDGDIKSWFGLSIIKDNNEEVSFSNGSSLFIRTSFRSATLQRLHISEFGKIANKYPERAVEVKTGTLQAIREGNTVAIESTAEGINEFKRMWDTAEGLRAAGTRLAGKDFNAVFLSWLDDPDCVSGHEEAVAPEVEDYFGGLEGELGREVTREQRNFWVQQYRELGDAIYQEYPSTPEEAFAKTNDGTYYANQYKAAVLGRGREKVGLYDPQLKVRVAMDLGVDDVFVLVFFQVWRDEVRVIREYKNHGEGLEHYISYIDRCRYQIEELVVPHDIRVRELGTGNTRLARLRELVGAGVSVRVLPRGSIEDGIEAVRRVLPGLWMDAGCAYLRGCLMNYCKEWDDKLETWKPRPLHNDWSHGADALRYMAMSVRPYIKSVSNENTDLTLSTANGLSF